MAYPNTIAHGVMFHHFHDSMHYQGQGSLSREDFDRMLHFIGLDRIISPHEWIQRCKTRSLRPQDICLTFDDSLKCQFDVSLPVLDMYGLKAFWFVYSNVFEGRLNKLEIYRVFRLKYFKTVDDFYRVFFERVFNSEYAGKAEQVAGDRDIMEYQKAFPFYSAADARFRLVRDRALLPNQYEYIMDGIIKDRGLAPEVLAENIWMSNDHLKHLSGGGHFLGLHSYSHPTVLARLSRKEQREEYRKNHEHLKKVSGTLPVVMAHPSGSYNRDTFRVLESFGILCGFRSNMLPGQISGSVNGHKYEMAREDSANLMRMKYENQ